MKRLHVLFPVVLASCAQHSVPSSQSQGALPRSVQVPNAAATTEVEAAPVPEVPVSPSVGTLEIKTEAGEPQTVALASIEVNANVRGDFVEAQVAHVFDSHVAAQSEGTFRFPLPEGAILLGLAMEVDGKLVRGEIVEREKAKKVFEQIEDQMRDPALLEWDQGSVFKLRVFPVDPGEQKRILLHYAAPLRRSAFLYPLAPATGQTIGHAKVSLDGKTILDERNLATRREVTGPIIEVPSLVEQTRGADRYLAVHMRPDWSKVSRPAASGPKRIVLVVDTSRSMLEERKLTLLSIRKILEALGDKDEFQILASDIEVRKVGTQRKKSEIDKAIEELSAVEPDGASDIGAMIRAVGKIVKEQKATAVVYVGDGSATWGQMKSDELEKLAVEELGAIPMHSMLLGDRADVDTMQGVAASTGAMVEHPKTEIEAEHFARSLARASELKRIERARIATSEGEVLPSRERTLYEGEELSALVHAPKNASLSLRADGIEIPLTASPVSSTLVTERFAKARISALEGMAGDHKEEIVKISLENGVLSKHTSLLVLESDEAYKQFAIARRNTKSDRSPSVTGADLESASSRLASLDPDHLQPGDPEVRIDAPSSARRVSVLLPFGETKEATYDPTVHAWTVRFLVDRNTPDGTYEVIVTIEMADGTTEWERLHYVVDTQHPNVEVTMRPVRHHPGRYEIRATQVITEQEIAAAIPSERRTGTLDEQRARWKSELEDARRVDVRLPEGTVLSLVSIALGEFRGFWEPVSPLAGPVTLHVVAFDRARNQFERDVTVGR